MKEEFTAKSVFIREKTSFEKLHELYRKHGREIDAITAAMPQEALHQVTIDRVGVGYTIAGDSHDLAKAIRAVRTRGYTTNWSPPKENDPSWSGFYNKEDGPEVYISFTSKVCRRVKIGTKTVEQDVYEIQCGDQGESVAAPTEG